METKVINKVAILKLKDSIKNAVERQKFYKNQRKTVNKDCSRKFGDLEDISPSEATWKHRSNREVLRIMYLAYALLRGKDFATTDKNYQDVPDSKILAMAEMFEKEAEKNA